MSNDQQANVFHGTGKIVYNDFEGGFYGIEADNGQKYYPLNLNNEFKVSGLKIRFELQIQLGIMSVVMWGVPVKVIVLESVDE